MKVKRLLSLMTAMAMSVSMFAGLATTASAATGNGWISTGAVTNGTSIIDNDVVKATMTTFDAGAGSNGVYDGVEYATATNLRIDSGKNGGVLEVTPAKDGTLTLIYRRQADDKTSGNVTSGSGKDVKVMDGTTQLKATFFEKNSDPILKNGVVEYQAVKSTYGLTAGKTYQIYGKGTTVQLYEMVFTPVVNTVKDYNYQEGDNSAATAVLSEVTTSENTAVNKITWKHSEGHEVSTSGTESFSGNATHYFGVILDWKSILAADTVNEADIPEEYKQAGTVLSQDQLTTIIDGKTVNPTTVE